MSQSYTSVRSTHSDSSATTLLTNTKSLPRNATPSLHPQRRRLSNRRNLRGLAAGTRDRRNSLNKSDQQTVLQSIQHEQEQKSPLIRNLENILNEHLKMMKNLLLSYPFNGSIQGLTQNPSIRDFVYTRLHELSQENPMNQRCSRVETKAFIDLISDFQMNRAHHYSFLTDSVKDLLISNNDKIHFSNRCTGNEDDVIKGKGYI
jgi:hypothetical protein